jgi:putative ABC transport system permease protein
MVKNYFKIALRNLFKNKVHSFINIAGLSVGITISILIGFWIWDELSFNKYHQNYNHIVQVIQKQRFLGETKVWTHMPYRLVNELQRNYKNDFKYIVISTEAEERPVSFGQKKLSETGIFIDSSAPEMLTLKMLKGSWAALKDPHSIILSASAANSLFGDSDPINKPVVIRSYWDANEKIDVKVTGVYEDLPKNSEFNEIQFFSPWELFAAINKDWLNSMQWDDHHFPIYAELQPNIEFDMAASNVKDAELRENLGITYCEDVIGSFVF